MIVVNSSTRQFNIPGADMTFGVEADNGSERKVFQCPRYVGNGLDVAGSFVRINYRNANGDIDSYLVDDVTVDGDNITFSWELTPKVTAYKGQIRFVMCVTGPDTKVAWHTTLGTGVVLEGLEPDYVAIQADTADVVAQLIALVGRQTAAVTAEGTTQVAVVKAAAKAAETASVAEIEAKGKNVRESIPDDYTALSEAVDGLVRGRAPGIVCSAEGTAIAVADASNMAVQGMRIFGRSVQDGVPSPDAPVEIVSIENPTITVGNQALHIPRTLPGIPVTSGGNYTDRNGQQWICDEVDLERGVYVRRIGSKEFTGAANENWFVRNETPVIFYIAISDKRINYEPVPNVLLCSHFPVAPHMDAYQTECITETYYRNGNLNILINHQGVDTLDEFRAFLLENPMTVRYVLATPIETPLTETEIAAYRAIHTHKPNTTVLNDAGAHMAVEYVADTKLYIDNKIKEALR